MPMYEYHCKKCDENFDKIVSVDNRQKVCDDPCPNCGEKECIELVIAAINFVDTYRLDGRQKPTTEFRDRMKQMKKQHRNDPFAKIKDY
jgi:putative FmdB family regulatory protein